MAARDGLSRRALMQRASGSAPVGNGSASTAGDADLALVNGKILTMDGHSTIASAIAIREGRIVEVGRTVGRSARTIDLKGAAVIPGLIDAHHHIFGFTNGAEARDIELARSLKELLAAIAAQVKVTPRGQFISCDAGWNRRALAEKRLPTRAELDTVAPDHPVWLSETIWAWGEGPGIPTAYGYTNGAGLAFFRAHGLDGNPSTGAVARNEAKAIMGRVMTDADRRRSLQNSMDFAVRHAVTMIHDFGSQSDDGSLESEYPYMIDLWRAQELKLRFRLRLGVDSLEALRARMENGVARLGDDVVRLNGFGEGLPGGMGPEFIEAASLVAKHGWSAHVHSVEHHGAAGDVGENIFHTQAYRTVNATYPLKDLRWSLAHANYITPELTRQLVEMGVGVTGDAWKYTTEQPEPQPMGPPWRMLVDSGIPLGAGSDGTGTSGFNPWITLYYMTTGRINTGEVGNPGQTISRMEALRVHSLGSAWHSFDDHHLGSLEVGKLADLAVLSHDPLTVSDDDLRRITSSLTLQAGKVVHEAA